MISKEQVIERIHKGARLEIAARFDAVELRGLAVCDAVIGSEGREKLRAKFGHGIKAVLELRDYGKRWEAEEAPEMPAPPPKEKTKAAEGESGLPWYGDTPEEKEAQQEALEALRRESKRLYDAERYRRKKAAQTPEEAEIERQNKRQYDKARYLARKQREAAAPPQDTAPEAEIQAEG